MKIEQKDAADQLVEPSITAVDGRPIKKPAFSVISK